MQKPHVTDADPMSIESALQLAKRNYYPPVPELLLLAGLEARQRPPSLRQDRSGLDALAALQADILDQVSACFCDAVHDHCRPTEERDELLAAAAGLNRRAAARAVERCLRCFLVLHPHELMSAVPLRAWADYLTCAALARSVVLIGSASYDAHADSGGADRLCALHTVTGCFWDTGGEDPVIGIAGWVAPHADDPGFLVSALVVGEQPLLNELRLSAMHDFAPLAVAGIREPYRLAHPFQIEAAA